jgi:YVTN family beta-propeller protein
MLALLAAIVLRTAPIAVTPDGTRVVVANPDSASISILEVSTLTRTREITTCAKPQTVSVNDDRAWVACGEGRVVLVDLTSMEVIARTSIGVEPFGVIATSDALFISDPGDAAVYELDPHTLASRTRIATKDHPRGMALHDGKLLVTHFRSGDVTEIDVSTHAITRVLSTGSDTNLSQSIFIAGGRAYLPLTRSNTTNRSLRFDTTVFPTVSMLDIQTGDHIKRDRIAIDTMDQPSNMPLDLVVTSTNKLYVVNAGSDDVSVLDLVKRTKVAHVSAGANPRGIALTPDESLAFITNSLGGTVSVLDTRTDAMIATIATTSIPLAPILLRGKILFNSASTTALAKDRWISCATCHFEGGTDGRTWFFPDGPRNTQPLFGVAATTPLHWSGDLDELQDVENTIRTIQSGEGLVLGESHCAPTCDSGPSNAHRSDDLDALAAFMTTLRAPRRPSAASEAISRGEAVFNRASCGSCHPAPLYTDRRKHDVGTSTSTEEVKGSAFDTPSLRGLSDTAPYLHDGTAATLTELLERHGAGITEAERDDVIAFLRSLPFLEPKRRAAN